MSRRTVLTLPTWVPKLRNAANAPARVVYAGSSTTAGAAASVNIRRYVSQLDTKFQTANPAITDSHYFYGMTNEDPYFSNSGGISTFPTGLVLWTWKKPQSSTVTFTATFKQVTIHFLQGPSYGNFSYKIDGGTSVPVTVNSTGADDRQDGAITIDTGSLASHTLLITATTNNFGINGITTHSNRPDRGVFTYNSGHGGTRSQDFADSIVSFQQRINQIAPDLFVYMIGTNDYSAQIPIATYKANVLTVLNGIRANVSSNPDILVVGTYKYYGSESPDQIKWVDYLTAMQEVAGQVSGCFYVDISSFYPVDAAHDPRQLMSGDNVHQTDAGHSFMAGLLYGELK